MWEENEETKRKRAESVKLSLRHLWIRELRAVMADLSPTERAKYAMKMIELLSDENAKKYRSGLTGKAAAKARRDRDEMGKFASPLAGELPSVESSSELPIQAPPPGTKDS